MTRTRSFDLLAVALAAPLCLAACGDDDSDSSSGGEGGESGSDGTGAPTGDDGDGSGGDDGTGGDDGASGDDGAGGVGVVPCLDGQYCPDGCTCDTDSGLGTCQLDDGSGACEFGAVADDALPPAFTELSGDWVEAYICINQQGCEQEPTFSVVITQQGASLEAEFTDYGDSISGNLRGTNFEWSFESETYDEVGIWTFLDEHNFSKTSRWTSNIDDNGGDCFGIATKDANPPPIPLPPDCE
jgi:hypothetical protein